MVTRSAWMIASQVQPKARLRKISKKIEITFFQKLNKVLIAKLVRCLESSTMVLLSMFMPI